jgi:hypothetical protein
MFRSALLALVALGLWCAPAHAAEPAALVGTPERTAQVARAADACDAVALVCVGGAVAGAIGDVAGDVITTGATATSGALMGPVVRWVAEGAAWLIAGIGELMDRSTRPALTSGWFTERYAGMAQLAVLMSALFLLLSVGEAIVAQDVTKLLRSTFLALPYALLLTFAAVALVDVALAVTDWMTAWVMRGSRESISDAFQSLSSVLSTAPSGPMAPFAVFLGSNLIAIVALLLWLELVMREAAIYVAVAFLPLTLVAMVWERTAHWIRRLAEWLLALILAKFTIAVAFALAGSAIGEAHTSDGGLSRMLAGCAVLLVAALTPWALLRLIPLAEAAAGRTLTGGEIRAATSSLPGVSTATSAAKFLLLGYIGGGAAVGAGAVAATSLASREPVAGGPLPALSPDRVDERSRGT